jgi:hypothetical protein
MTLAERNALIAVFRQMVEDFFRTMETRLYFKHGTTPYNDEGVQYVEDGVPYASVEEALTLIPEGMRIPYFIKLNVAGVDHWFLPDGSLVPYIGDLSLEDNSVALSKLVNIATASFIGRKTAGDGSPEILSVADVKTLLGLTDINFNNYVTKVLNYSLVPNSEIAKIHAATSDNQDLSGLVEKVDGSRLITTEELALLNAGKQAEFRIILPSASTVAGRCVTPVELPSGWTVVAGVVDTDLVITHNLNRECCLISVMSVDGATFEKSNQPIGSNYNNFKEDRYSNIVTIQGLATVEKQIIIHLLFGQTSITQPA